VKRGSRLVGLVPACGIAILLCSACGTSPDEQPLEGTYSAAFEPPLAVDGPGFCERFILYAILSLGGGDFDVSVNVGDDCRRLGGEYTFFEIGDHGTYTRRADTLTFTVGQGPGQRFTGQLEGEYLRLLLPEPYGELATHDVELRLGPRVPF
jgi:hypothetical protein